MWGENLDTFHLIVTDIIQKIKPLDETVFIYLFKQIYPVPGAMFHIKYYQSLSQLDDLYFIKYSSKI